MSYFKVGEPYYKIGDWVNIILPEYDSKTIWKIVEIEFLPDGLSMVKLQNVLYYDETVKTTIDNIRPVPRWRKDSPTTRDLKTAINAVYGLKTEENAMSYYYKNYKVDDKYYKIGDWVKIPPSTNLSIFRRDPRLLYADLHDTNLKNNLKHIIDMSYDKIREESEGGRDMYYLACDIKTKNTVACYTNIKKVIFNDPATIIFWKDGSKTVVKCGPDEKYDPEKGMAMAIAKRVYGTSETGGNYYNIFKKWLPEEKL